MAELERSAAPRNGLPEFRPYTYKGTGEDIYSPRRVVARLHEQIAARSPGRAALVAEFERRQAAMATVPEPRTPDPAPAPPPRHGGQPLRPVRLPDHRGRAPGDVR